MDQSNFIVIIVEDVILKILKKKAAVQIQPKSLSHHGSVYSSPYKMPYIRIYLFVYYFFNLQSQSSELKFSAG